jgi:hypothetical protein
MIFSSANHFFQLPLKRQTPLFRRINLGELIGGFIAYCQSTISAEFLFAQMLGQFGIEPAVDCKYDDSRG